MQTILTRRMEKLRKRKRMKMTRKRMKRLEKTWMMMQWRTILHLTMKWIDLIKSGSKLVKVSKVSFAHR